MSAELDLGEGVLPPIDDAGLEAEEEWEEDGYMPLALRVAATRALVNSWSGSVGSARRSPGLLLDPPPSSPTLLGGTHKFVLGFQSLRLNLIYVLMCLTE